MPGMLPQTKRAVAATPHNATLSSIAHIIAPAAGFFMYVERKYVQGEHFTGPAKGTVSAILFCKKPWSMGVNDTYQALCRGMVEPLRAILGESEVQCNNGVSVKKGQTFPLWQIEQQIERYPETPVFYGQYDIATGRITPLSLESPKQ